MSAKNILIIGPAWVGDMVMAQVLFILLKQNNATTNIDVLAPGWSLPLLERMPEVRTSFISPFGHGELNLKKRYEIAQQLKANHYDQAIVLPNSFKSALIPWLAGIGQRTSWLGEWRFGLLNDFRWLDKKKYPLMIERFAALAFPSGATLPATLPKPHFSIKAENVQAALVKHQLTDVVQSQPIIAMCPGAEFGASKRWPAAYYAQVAQAKLDEGYSVWLFGSVKDQVVTEEIQAITAGRCIDLAGKTSLFEAIDLLSLAEVVVTNDSGLMHIAAALNRPLVAMYGSTSPHFTPPLADHAEVLSTDISCRPCFKRECPLGHHRCMQDLLPGRVLTAIQSLTKETISC